MGANLSLNLNFLVFISWQHLYLIRTKVCKVLGGECECIEIDWVQLRKAKGLYEEFGLERGVQACAKVAVSIECVIEL